MKGVSVIVCCYNSALRLPSTLKHLGAQVTDFSWEIIIVNNASTDNTNKVALATWTVFGAKNIPIIICDQPIPGLSHARTMGIEKSTYSIIVFCDDDNWLSPDYLQIAFVKMGIHHNAGIIGGWCEGKFDRKVESWLVPMMPALAIGKQAVRSGEIGRTGKTLYGAGMILRKNSVERLFEKGYEPILEDRKSIKLTSGGDTELCWAMIYSGYELFFFDELFFLHYMPSQRQNKKYFLKLTLSNVKPVVVLAMYSYLYKNGSFDFTGFRNIFLWSKVKSSFYFLPRVFFGKNQFYSMICFFQDVKVICVLVTNIREFDGHFQKIKQYRIQFEKND